ncbi:MAG: IS5/IS1182 family transposase, partial [Bacteroidales bacterium]|nr:IS5/IS1182 family transposase [Bacteroidales bacterium]
MKYNMFHAEMKRKRKKNPFLVENMFYNRESDFYVCPMGQHLEVVKEIKEKSDLGYESTKSMYRAKGCSRCPLRSMCYKGKHNAR